MEEQIPFLRDTLVNYDVRGHMYIRKFNFDRWPLRLDTQFFIHVNEMHNHGALLFPSTKLNI